MLAAANIRVEGLKHDLAGLSGTPAGGAGTGVEEEEEEEKKEE